MSGGQPKGWPFFIAVSEVNRRVSERSILSNNPAIYPANLQRGGTTSVKGQPRLNFRCQA